MFKLNIIFVYLYMYTLYILCADLEEFFVGGGGSEGYLCRGGLFSVIFTGSRLGNLNFSEGVQTPSRSGMHIDIY